MTILFRIAILNKNIDMIMRMNRFCLIALMLSILTACGHKAPLYLPAPEPVKQGEQIP